MNGPVMKLACDLNKDERFLFFDKWWTIKTVTFSLMSDRILVTAEEHSGEFIFTPAKRLMVLE